MIGIGRVDHDARDVMRVAQPHVRPRLAGILRLVDAVARVRAARAARVAGSDPDDPGIRRRDGDGADRQLVLAIEDRREGRRRRSSS